MIICGFCGKILDKEKYKNKTKYITCDECKKIFLGETKNVVGSDV